MPYAKRPNLSSIQEEIPRIESLRPGDSLPLQGTKEAIKACRYQIYAWMHSLSITHLYKIRTMSPELIIITRRVKHTLKIAYSGPPKQLIEFVALELAEILDEDEAIQRIRESLPKTQWIQAADEWRRLVESGGSIPNGTS